MDNKLKIIENKINLIKDQLKKYGWEYVVDNFTCSKYGHRRERFEREDTSFKNWIGKSKWDVVLIFHYKNEYKYNEPNIQTYSNVEKDKDNYLYLLQEPSCYLHIQEMELFLKFMKLIRQKDKLLVELLKNL